jgi:hypothetical protein
MTLRQTKTPYTGHTLKVLATKEKINELKFVKEFIFIKKIKRKESQLSGKDICSIYI